MAVAATTAVAATMVAVAAITAAAAKHTISPVPAKGTGLFSHRKPLAG